MNHLSDIQYDPSTPFYAIIGPEGGFDENEVAQLEKSKCVPVCLNDECVLRIETASLAFSSVILNYLSRYD